MLQVRNGLAKLDEILPALHSHSEAHPMERFEVKQEQEDIWSVSSQGCVLYFYPSEEEARMAALMLASDTCQSGTQATVIISPAELSNPLQSYGGTRRFTGM
jgi:hypothetical protein